MPSRHRIASALAVGACLIASGCGSDDDYEPATTAAPPATTATSATEALPAPTTPSTPGSTQPQASAPAPGPPSVTAEGRRFTERSARACTRVRRTAKGVPARLPPDPAKLPEFARSVLPIYQESRAALEKERPRRRPVQSIDELIGAYDALLPVLQQLAAVPPNAPPAEVRSTAQLLPGALARVEGAALSAGIPACGSPRRP
ncbi:MAG: hypothetical protein AVDCRST_MAG85-4320 [uncultured Solirubrobacteraceae bacterium]|uniref:Lipoprotein n=1 Tax=uncultured Solirubrobacteraceae bacterium TaxID=1162706 RepID=A0A6J4U1S6_9ACTN|nr:MAG: hypothetical protein AVDCRST_MAG85-4320 [uncultured Solirubrobacteraceae bacterium]